MSITLAIESLVIAKWAPNDWLTTDDVVWLAKDFSITDARSTIQRTMQELRERGIVSFGYPRGNYQRLAVKEEIGTSIRDQVRDARRLRERHFAYQPNHQALVDARIKRLIDSLPQQTDTSLRDIPEVLSECEAVETETVANVMTRLGQGHFRDELISYWDRCCAVTKCNLLRILRASHIKPWRDSNDHERLDVYNGLLLVPQLDALFDEGLISFDDAGRMQVSSLLDDTQRKLFRVPVQTQIAVRNEHAPYLKYHRDNIFIS